jgi:hypothetical protein
VHKHVVIASAAGVYLHVCSSALKLLQHPMIIWLQLVPMATLTLLSCSRSAHH